MTSSWDTPASWRVAPAREGASVPRHRAAPSPLPPSLCSHPLPNPLCEEETRCHQHTGGRGQGQEVEAALPKKPASTLLLTHAEEAYSILPLFHPHSLLPQQSKQGKGPCCFRPLKEKEKERAAHPPRLACDKPQKSSAAAKPGD